MTPKQLLHQLLLAQGMVLLPVLVILCASGALIMLYAVHWGAEHVQAVTGTWRAAVLFIVAFGLFIVTRVAMLRLAIYNLETMIYHWRIVWLHRVARADWARLESLAYRDFHARLVEDLNSLPGAVYLLINALTSSVVITLAMVYIAWFSPAGLLVTILVLGAIGAVFWRQRQLLQQAWHQARKQDARINALLFDILSGFRELKLCRSKRDAALDDLARQSGHNMRTKKYAGILLSFNAWGESLLMILLLGVAVFLLPMLYGHGSVMALKITTTVLFITNSLLNLLKVIPVWSRLQALTQRLDQLQKQIGPVDALPIRVTNDWPELYQVRARIAAIFNQPPWEISLHPGAALFITGGNGSGKTTLLKRLCGLYPQVDCQFWWNGQKVYDMAAYRSQFAAVFSQPHVFRFFPSECSEEEALQWLRLFALEKVVHYHAGVFRFAELSTGMYKRLALVQAILLDRPVLLLDEWAAEQDPAMRAWFYTQFIPKMTALGKALIVVSHDEAFFSLTAQVMRMENGRLTKSN